MSATAEHISNAVCIGQSLSVVPAESVTKCKPAFHLDAMSGRCRELLRGRHLFLAGDPCRHVHMIVSGSFKVYATSLDGDERVLGFFLPGDALGLEAATSQTHRYSAVALEDADVSEISLECLQGELNSEKIHNKHELLQRLCFETIANNYTALHGRSTKFAEQRLSSFLLGLWDRFDATTQARGELSLSMSRQDIGDYLGLALGTISRTFSQLEQQSLIKVRCRSVQMLDPDALRRIVCSERIVSSTDV